MQHHNNYGGYHQPLYENLSSLQHQAAQPQVARQAMPSYENPRQAPPYEAPPLYENLQTVSARMASLYVSPTPTPTSHVPPQPGPQVKKSWENEDN
jgi:hypothetical protein